MSKNLEISTIWNFTLPATSLLLLVQFYVQSKIGLNLPTLQSSTCLYPYTYHSCGLWRLPNAINIEAALAKSSASASQQSTQNKKNTQPGETPLSMKKRSWSKYIHFIKQDYHYSLDNIDSLSYTKGM